MKKTDLLDYDLDVQNVLKDFPENDSDGYIYVRGSLDDNGNINDKNAFINTKGTNYSLNAALVSLFALNEDFRNLGLNAVLNFLNNNPNEIKEFKKHLEAIEILNRNGEN